MLNRKIINDLRDWKKSKTRKPLILRGARQVGKTSVINQFGSEYAQYIHINLEINKKLFLEYTSIELLVEAIFFVHKKDINLINKTLLFIDEIQEVPEAINLLRYFYETYPSLHVVAAGSLLEALLLENTTFPVGRVEFMVMHPFNFTEYLLALDEKKLIEAMEDLESKPYATDLLFEHFHKYALIGGMPEIVETYVESRNLTSLNKIYTSLLHAYLNDISKYARNSTMDRVLRHCMNQIFYFGGRRIAFANFGNSNYRSREIGEALNTLQRAMILQLVYPCTSYEIPLSQNFRKFPKLLILDTGLMNFFAGLQTDIIGTNDIGELYAGRLAEQIVGQELTSNFISPLEKNLFWASGKEGSEAEVDFVIQYNKLTIPVEVKSGKIGKLKSLLQFMEFTKMPVAVRLYRGSLLIHKATTGGGHEFTLINLPYFLASKLNTYLDQYLANQLNKV